MKKSFTTLATPGLSGVEAIRLARRYGYDGIDLRAAEESADVSIDATNGHIDELLSALNGEGVALSSLMAYNAAGGTGQASWSAMADSARRYLELAHRMGAEAVRLTLGRKPDTLSAADYGRCLTQLLVRLAEEEKPEAAIVLQNHHHSISALECAEIIRKVNHPQVRMIVSTDHCVRQSESAEAVGAAAGAITGQLYMADIRLSGQGYEDVLPGAGDAPLEAYWSALGGASFPGWVTFKWEKRWRPELADYETALPHFIQFVKRGRFS